LCCNLAKKLDFKTNLAKKIDFKTFCKAKLRLPEISGSRNFAFQKAFGYEQ